MTLIGSDNGWQGLLAAFAAYRAGRLGPTLAFAGLALWFRASWTGVLATVLAMGGSLLVSYARARGEGLGIHYKGGLMQRAERLVLLALASLLDPVATARAAWPPGTMLFGMVAFIGVASLATALHRTVAISRALEREDAARG